MCACIRPVFKQAMGTRQWAVGTWQGVVGSGQWEIVARGQEIAEIR